VIRKLVFRIPALYRTSRCVEACSFLLTETARMRVMVFRPERLECHTGVTMKIWAFQILEKKSLWQPDL
jgi:hypothetical protein